MRRDASATTVTGGSLATAVATTAIMGGDEDYPSVTDVLRAWRDPTLHVVDRRDVVIQYAVAMRALASKALLALRSVDVARDAPSVSAEFATAMAQRLLKPVPRLSGAAVACASLARASTDPSDPRVAAVGRLARTSLGPLFVATRDALCAEALVAPLVNARVGAELPPRATVAIVGQQRDGRCVAEFRARAQQRETSRWLVANAAAIRSLGFVLITQRRAADQRDHPTDDDGVATLRLPLRGEVRLVRADGAPQVVKLVSHLDAPVPVGDAVSAVRIADHAYAIGEVNSAFHSRGATAGLLAVKALFAGVQLQLFADQGKAMHSRTGTLSWQSANGTTVQRVSDSGRVAPPSVRFFLGAAGGPETMLVAVEVDTRRMDVVATVTGAAGVPSAPVVLPRGCTDHGCHAMEVGTAAQRGLVSVPALLDACALAQFVAD
jgi:hypothetical protein